MSQTPADADMAPCHSIYAPYNTACLLVSQPMCMGRPRLPGCHGDEANCNGVVMCMGRPGAHPGCCGDQAERGGVVRRQRRDAQVLVVHAPDEVRAAVVLLPDPHVEAVEAVGVDHMHPLVRPCAWVQPVRQCTLDLLCRKEDALPSYTCLQAAQARRRKETR